MLRSFSVIRAAPLCALPFTLLPSISDMSPSSQQSFSLEQELIVKELGVCPSIVPAKEFERRVDFLHELLIQNQKNCLILGISGGVDSLTAGLIAQKAVEKSRAYGRQAKFIAMRLPYGEQRDEDDAQSALQLIQPDETLTVNIKPASDGMLASLKAGGLAFRDEKEEDFILGNIKARQRMIAQYAVAGHAGGLVIGTDHAAEALMGFFTKHGDGACDVTPLSGLNKRQIRSIAQHCGASVALAYKVPTADLETLTPLKPDEVSFGLPYDDIDDFLEGKIVSPQAYEIILRQYRSTEHKRTLPISLVNRL